MYKLTKVALVAPLALARVCLLALSTSAVAAEPVVNESAAQTRPTHESTAQARPDETNQLRQLIEKQALQLGQLKQSLEEQQRKSAEDRRALDAQKAQLQALQRQVENHGADLNRRFAQPNANLDLYAGRGAAPQQGANAPQSPIVQAQQEQQQQPAQAQPPGQAPA
jgi:chromosome segregation ATPase